MGLLDDQPLSRHEPPRPGLPEDSASSRAYWIGGLVAAAILVGGLARWWTLDRADPAPLRRTSANARSGTEVAVAPPAPVLPPLGEMDPFLRVLLGTLSSRPELSRWLATDDLIRQLAVIVDRVSQGASPARELKVLTPAANFETTRLGRDRVISRSSYTRYDGLAETIASLDADAVGRAYRTIKPRLAEAYRALGRSNSDVDVAVAAALEKLASTPEARDPIAVREGKGATWAFADSSLEALDPAQKHLLRMGPANARRIQAKLREIGAAIARP